MSPAAAGRYDVAVVGAGIVGLAQAWAAARRGLRVVVLERDARAQSASIRNFGMIWPIGQPAGEAHQTALRSRERWLELAKASGLWLNECGSLHLAHRDDEWQVLQEFAARAPNAGYDVQLLSPAQVQEKSPAANPQDLRGGLWSPTELCVDPREAAAVLASWLAESFAVEFRFSTAVVQIDHSTLTTADQNRIQADQIYLAIGADWETLIPGLAQDDALRRCKLQMMRTPPQPKFWRLGPHLAGGLTLRHYQNFEPCPSLPALKKRIAEESPDLDRYGIHVMAAQNQKGEIVLGDSHEYGPDISPFDKAPIETLMLQELRRIIRLPNWTIAERWHGVYSKNAAAPQYIQELQPGVRVITATGGAGMTMAFGLAEKEWAP